MSKILNELKKKKSENKFSGNIKEILTFLKENNKRKFDETINLDIFIKNKKKNKKITKIKGVCFLPQVVPRSIKKKKKIIVFSENQVEDLKKMNYEVYGINHITQFVQEKKIPKANLYVAHPDMIKSLIKIGKFLGNLMPSNNNSTISNDLLNFLPKLEQGTFYNTNDSGQIQVSIGKISFSIDALEENIKIFLKEILQHQKKNKDEYIDSIYLSTTMGLSFKINIPESL